MGINTPPQPSFMADFAFALRVWNDSCSQTLRDHPKLCHEQLMMPKICSLGRQPLAGAFWR